MRRLTQKNEFSNFNELSFKLLVYFTRVRNSKDLTPWTTIDDLSVRVGASWRRTKKALSELREIGVIRQVTQRRQFQIMLVFKDPFNHELNTAGQTPLRPFNADSLNRRTATKQATGEDFHLDASVEGCVQSSLYVKTSENRHHFGKQTSAKSQASQQSNPEGPSKQFVPGETSGLPIDSEGQFTTVPEEEFA